MGKRQRQWAARARTALLARLGAVCVGCGEVNIEKLQFDVIDVTLNTKHKGDHHHKLDSSRAIAFYRMMKVIDNIQVLCERCNNLKSHIDKKVLEKHNDKNDKNKTK